MSENLIDTRKNDNFNDKKTKFYEAFVDKKIQTDAATGKEYFDVTIASENLDSMGDVLLLAGGDFKRFNQNPVVLYQHKADYFPIGTDLGLTVEGNKLKGKMWLHEIEDTHSQTVKALILAGVIKCISIGFMIRSVNWEPLTDAEKKKLPNYYSEKRIITSWEMMEYSVVNIPANTDATIKSYVDGLNVKSATFNIAEAIEQIDKELNNLDIEQKAGATLSKKTKETVTKIKSLLSEANQHIEDLITEDAPDNGITQVKELEATIKDLKLQNDALNLELAEIKKKPKLTKLL